MAVAALGAVLALGACGGGGGSGTAGNPFGAAGGNGGGGGGNGGGGNGGNGNAQGGKLTVKIDLTGEVTLNGTLTMGIPGAKLINTCADYVKGSHEDGQSLFALPSLISVDTGKIDGKELAIDALIEDYTGPGSYGRDKIAGNGSEGGILIDYKPYSVLPEGTSSQVVVDASGGGSWTFTRLAFDDGSGNPSPGINGKITWTCQD